MSDDPSRRATEQHGPSTEGGACTTHEFNPNPPGTSSRPSYTFIDSRVQQARLNEVVRVHVMRESHRARRLAQGHATSIRGGGELHLWDIGEPSGAQVPRSPTTEQANRERATRTFSSVQSASLAEDQGLILPQIPIDILGASRRDPFAQYPALQAYQVDFLVDFYITEKAYLSHELLPVYRNDAASFHALLAFSALLLAQKENLDQFLRPAELESRTLEILSSRLATSPLAHINGTITAVALMAYLEECRGNIPTARLHWSAVKQMVRDRGGLESICSDRNVHAALLRLDVLICTSGISSLHQPYITPYPEDATSLLSLSASTIESTGQTQDEQKLSSTVEEYIQLFDDLVTAISTSAFVDKNPLPPSLIDIFHHQESLQLEPLAQKMFRCAKMACLIYLSLSSRPLNSPPQQFHAPTTSDSTSLLEDALLNRTASHPVCVEELLYMQFSGVECPDTEILNHHVWRVSRLMGVARRLGQRSWDMCYEILACFLKLSDIDPAPTGEIVPEWRKADIRDELEHNGGAS